MKQRGSLLVFKIGTPMEEIDLVLKMLVGSEILDPHFTVETVGQKRVPPLHEFNPKVGGPVWYIP